MKLTLPSTLRKAVLLLVAVVLGPAYAGESNFSGGGVISIGDTLKTPGSVDNIDAGGGLFSYVYWRNGGTTNITGTAPANFYYAVYMDIESNVSEKADLCFENAQPDTNINLSNGTKIIIDPQYGPYKNNDKLDVYGTSSNFNGAEIILNSTSSLTVRNTMPEGGRGTLDIVDTSFSVNGSGTVLSVDNLTHSFAHTTKTVSTSSITATDGGTVELNDFSGEKNTTTLISLGTEGGEEEAASSFSSGSYTNSGTTDIKLYDASTFMVDDYVSDGLTTIYADAGTTCTLSNVQMLSGDIVVDGTGTINLAFSSGSGEGGEGSTAGSTVFTVAAENGEADATCIDISSLNPETSQFTVDTSAAFTLVFTDDILQGVAEKGTDRFTLTLIKGYTGFGQEDIDLAAMLQNTSYQFGLTSTFALETQSELFTVTDAEYQMQGDDLVWTGAVSYSGETPAVPEPATATLSLLALAALAARRRRR